ncbi:MAG: hypothetical protein WKH64_12665, partial [Chloroflexia bacterium]
LLITEGEEGAMEDAPGKFDMFQIRRAALAADFMEAAQSNPEFEKLMKYIGENRQGGEQSGDKVAERWAETAAALRKDDIKDQGKYHEQGETFINMSKYLRFGEYSRKFPSLAKLYHEYFEGSNENPFRLEPIYSDAARAKITEYQYTLGELATATLAEESGDGAFAATGDASFAPSGPSRGDRRQTGDPADVQRSFSDSSWQGLDPRMKDRLTKMFTASGGRVWLGGGGGTRSTQAQEAMFRDRYYPSADGDIEFEGKRWAKRDGVAAAAPGRSIHELDSPLQEHGLDEPNASRCD